MGKGGSLFSLRINNLLLFLKGLLYYIHNRNSSIIAKFCFQIIQVLAMFDKNLVKIYLFIFKGKKSYFNINHTIFLIIKLTYFINILY